MANCDPWAAAANVRTAGRWRFAAAEWGSALTAALLDCVDLQPGSVVLDLAAGSGDPAFSIAPRLTDGHIVALDYSRAGLLRAQREATEIGLLSKLGFVQADAHQLPFCSHCFDRVTCRFGIMFFAEVDLALAEIFRVLRPSGRAAFLAWARFEQPFFDSTVGVVLRMVPGSSLPEAARAMFRFASPGSLEIALRRAGFRNVQERHASIPRVWAGTAEQLWQYQQEISTLCHPLFQRIPDELRPRVDEVVAAALGRFQKDNRISVPAEVVLATGQRDPT